MRGVADDVGDEHAIGAEHAGDGRDEDAANAQVIGQVAGMQRAGAAEGEQGEAPRVITALDGDAAQSAFHGGVGDAHHAQGGFFGAEMQPVAEFGQRPPCGVHIQRDIATPAQEAAGVEASEHEVGVGDGGL